MYAASQGLITGRRQTKTSNTCSAAGGYDDGNIWPSMRRGGVQVLETNRSLIGKQSTESVQSGGKDTKRLFAQGFPLSASLASSQHLQDESVCQ